MKNKNLSPERAMKIYNLKLLTMFLLVAGVFLLPKSPVRASEITPETLIKLTNKERIKNNLEPLSYSPTLEKAAKNKADDLIGKQYFSHTSPNNKTFVEWIKNVNYEYIYAGENLAMDFITSEGVVKAWMESESHKKNILSRNYSEIAIAISKGDFAGRPTIMITQLFGRPKDKSFLESGAQEKLTLFNFNAIINKDNEKQIVFPSIINPDELNIANLDKEYTIAKLSLATIKNDSPFIVKIETSKTLLNPRVAGEWTTIDKNKQFIINNSLLTYFSVISLFIITYLFSVIVGLIYKHNYPHLSLYK